MKQQPWILYSAVDVPFLNTVDTRTPLPSAAKNRSTGKDEPNGPRFGDEDDGGDEAQVDAKDNDKEDEKGEEDEEDGEDEAKFEAALKCVKCDKGFRTQWWLKQHRYDNVDYQDNPEKFTCEKCKKNYKGEKG